MMGDVSDAPAPPEPESGQDLIDLLERARAECAGHPELLDALDRLEQVPDLDPARRPEELDAIHQVLRQALANAGRTDNS